MNPTNTQVNPAEVRALTKAIALAENGGKLDLNNIRAGQSGEMRSIFQYTPGTWKAYSNEVYGKEVPLNNDTEIQVTAAKVAHWLQSGYKPEQVLSMWNAGSGEPNAWTGKFSSGKPSSSKAPGGSVNSYGVAYDVPGYVNKGMTYYKQNLQGGGGQMQGGQAVQSGQQESPEVQQALTTLKTLAQKYSTGPQVATAQQPQQGGVMGQLINGQQPPISG